MNETNSLLSRIHGRLGWILFWILVPYLVAAFWFGAALLVAVA